MSNNDNYLNDIFDNVFEETKKPFSEVFKLDKSTGDTKLIPLIPSQVSGHNLDQDRIIVEPLIRLNGELLQDLFNKILVGRTHKYSRVFYIVSWKD
jgi:hypothetical protein